MLDVRLKRITDLFIEGREVEMGYDEAGEPVLIWVNKPNSFEEEEARRDGLAARTESLLELKDDEHPDVVNTRFQMQAWSLEQLIERRVNQKYDEDFMAALNDMEADKEWADRIEFLRRGAALLDDAAVPADDPRRETYTKINDEYMTTLNKGIKVHQEQRRRDFDGLTREELVEAYLAEFREREAFTRFLAEKRVTDIFYAIRDCQAVRRDGRWDHGGCDHRRRLLVSRSDVRGLPQGVIETVINVLDNMSATPREAGNSAAPESSSASSEQPSAEVDSTPSIPAVTPAGAQRT